MGVFLAKRFVLLGEKPLSLQRSAAHSADKTGVMPDVSKSLQKAISCFDGELTAVAAGPKQTVKVLFTVGLPVLQVEGVVSDWLLTASAQEAVDMPRLFESVYHLSQNLGSAAATRWSKEVFIAVFTVDGALFLHKADICQRCSAVDTVELLLVPRLSHCYQEWSSDDHAAVRTHGRPSPCRKMLCHLNQRVLVVGMWLRKRSGRDRVSGRATVPLHTKRWREQTRPRTMTRRRAFNHGLDNCRVMAVQSRFFSIFICLLDCITLFYLRVLCARDLSQDLEGSGLGGPGTWAPVLGVLRQALPAGVSVSRHVVEVYVCVHNVSPGNSAQENHNVSIQIT